MSNTRISSLLILISIFFFWGFVAASNDILTPFFKDIFHLTQLRSQLVEWAFYISYFVGSLIYFIYTLLLEDPISRMGYKRALITGLLISSFGAICFIPSVNMHSYPMLLASLFIVGLGFTLQQIVANPYIIALGSPSTGAHRLNLAGGINSFGTTIGPVLLSLALFGQVTGNFKPVADIEAVKLPSIILCCLFLLSALILSVSKLPPITKEEHIEKDLGALRYPQLRLGMLAIFFYVGVEVTIGSNLKALLQLPEIKGISTNNLSAYVSLYWGGLMIGRWRGALSVFHLKKRVHYLLMALIPWLAFGVICTVNYLKSGNIEYYIYFTPFIFIAIIAFYLGKESPARMLVLFSSIAIALMVTGLFTAGNTAAFSFIAAGLFCSIMWPCIFTLAVAGLGKYTTQGSSLLIMMILGGGMIPLLQGWLVDRYGAHPSYWVTVVCFAYLAFYGWRFRRLFTQNVQDAEAPVEV